MAFFQPRKLGINQTTTQGKGAVHLRTLLGTQVQMLDFKSPSISVRVPAFQN